MKKYLFFLLLSITACCVNTLGQCSKDCKDCVNGKVTEKVKNKTMKTSVNKPMICKLTSPELRQRKEEVITKLKTLVMEKKELADGYAYKFDGTDQILDALTAFIKSERMCCDFFNFKLLVSNDSSVWLEISGADGAKEFIKTELEM